MNLSRFAFDGAEIRCTATGQPSVFDMIRVLGGKKSPRRTWLDLCKQHPEVVRKTNGFKFPGRGQQVTPVAIDKEAALYILGLLPGAAGRTYREEAARLFVRYLSGDTTLAEEVIRRSDDVEGLKRTARTLESRTTYLNSFHNLGDSLKSRGCEGKDYGKVHGHNNRLAGVPKGQRKDMTTRQEMTLTFLQAAEYLELDAAPEHIQKTEAAALCVSTGTRAMKLLKPKQN